jgi:hypothetical protein
MSRPFGSARLKIDRASHHLDIYKNQVRPFLDSKPYPVATKFNVNRTECRFNISITKPLPQNDWGLLIGDCVHNARAALDHLVWELAETFSGPIPNDRDTQFPIYDVPDPRQSFCHRAGRRISRLPVYAKALIEQLQPYNALNPREHLLWMLRDIDDTDKHKLIPVVAAAVQQPGAAWPGGPLQIIDGDFIYGPFINGAEVGFLRFAVPVPTEVKVESYFSIVETLGNSPPYIDSRHLLDRILYYVTRVVDVFENFPDHWAFLEILSIMVP